MNFVKKSLKYPQVTISILALAFLVGVYSLVTMPRREDPKINIRVGQIIAFYPGANSLQVEEQVTRKLEQYLFQYAEVRKEKTTSTTRDGVAIVYVWLNDDVENLDTFWSKLNHQLLVLKAAALPAGVVGPFVNYDFGDTEALVVGLEMDRPDYASLREYARKLEDNLKTIRAVSKIKRIGEQKEQIVITTDSARLEQYGITFAKVMQVLQSQNEIVPAGDVKTAEARILLYSRGYYRTEAEIADQIIGIARTGQVVRLKDVARVERRYSESTARALVNGRNSLLLAVQMHEGNNIVDFGKEVERKLVETAKLLPADVRLTTLVNQPKIVERNVGQFLKEFVLAIFAVIVIILLLLPFRVAAVAAMAIPMTVAVTFALMHAFGLELHQVSLACLIVVLGMVVDDAVVVADNYVELLDNGVDRPTAAWQCATGLVVPILTATLTIIAAFLPMVIITGMVHDFIIALPLTVSIALASSFIVAMLLTPMLCFVFIRKGLHHRSAEATEDKKRTSLLGTMQRAYDQTIAWCMKHPAVTIAGCLSSLLLALALFYILPQKFFPAAERNQFSVDLWMPTGTKLERTGEAVLKIQRRIQKDTRVVSSATFIGSGSPRFYYNFTPEMPVDNFAQILVNTRTDREARQLHHEINAAAGLLIPEGQVQARLMQQGKPSTTAIEIRIVGEEIRTLKILGEQVSDIIRKTRQSAFVRNDFKEDHYGVAIRLKEGAGRLGFTTGSIGKNIYGGFTGAPVSTLYEGQTPVDIVLRLDERKRRDFDDLQNMYLPSPATGAAVPLRQIASLEPEWHNGRIMHRNGLRTLTIQCEPVEGVLASGLLKQIRPGIDGLKLPPGYHIEYGGEYENQRETFWEMGVALGISLLLIFLILLFQFRSLKKTGIVMLTIPLSAFGALLGLWITHNPFGFTSFVGLISLSGLVVRNAIILIDHADELVEAGASIPDAAQDAGKRRLRPIFLTASAAAIGVIPMIISGSQLWSPLASVLAFGIMLAMVISLLLVPVLYAQVIKPSSGHRRLFGGAGPTVKAGSGLAALALAAALLFFPPQAGAAQNPEKLDLRTVTGLALQNNRLLHIRELQVEEKQQKVYEDRVKYLPSVIIGGGYRYSSSPNGNLNIDKGAIGEIPIGPAVIPLPLSDLHFAFGDRDLYGAGAILYQPVSQLPKIAAGVDVSKTDLRIAREEQAKAAMQVRQNAEKLYFGLLILQKQKEEAQIRLMLAQKRLYDAESAALAGKTTGVSAMGLRAAAADEEQNLLKINIQIDDYTADLKRMTGLLAEKVFILEPVPADDVPDSVPPADVLLSEAQKNNRDLKIASLQKQKAGYGVAAGRLGYLPDLGLVGGYTYLVGSPLYPEHSSFVGVSLKWNVQDVLTNTYVLKQRLARQKQAEENLANTREQVGADMEKTSRKIIQSAELITVAGKVLAFRQEDFQMQTDRHSAGLNLEADVLNAKAALAKAESDMLAARLQYRLALTDLRILTGNF